jgi:hypothetical protein
LREVAEPTGMTIPPLTGDTASLVAVRVEKIAQDQAKREGNQVVELIEQATPPVGPNGEGTHVNTYA